MKTLLIYDQLGNVFHNISGEEGSFAIPSGLPYLITEVPEGKRIKSTSPQVDVFVNPPVAIFEDLPESEIDFLRRELAATQEAVNYLLTK